MARSKVSVAEFAKTPSVDTAVDLMEDGAITVTGSVVIKDLGMINRAVWDNYRYIRTEVEIYEVFQEIPVGSFCCARCKVERTLGLTDEGCVHKAYALREMDDGGMTIAFGGLVCGSCVDGCGREFGGGPGQVRCASLSKRLYDYDGHAVLTTDYKNLVMEFQDYRDGGIWPTPMQDGNLPEVLYRRYLARKVSNALRSNVRLQKQLRERAPIAIPRIVDLLRRKLE
jgi:hypothetical protein